MASEEREFLIDLECGDGTPTTSPTTSEEDGCGDSISTCRVGRKALSRACSGALSYNGLVSRESDIDTTDDVSIVSNVACGRIEVVIDKCSGDEEIKDVVAVLEKKNVSKKLNMKKSCKPPRPPKGPLLSASDLKLVKELSELAARKRARIERMKAFRKMKETKRPTSSSNVTAMVMTALFFIVIIFQGAFSGNSTRNVIVESPAPATARESLMPFNLFNNIPTNEMNKPSSLSFRSLEQPSSSSPREEGRDAR